ncbi:hypothetical protein A9Q81_07320 [Gammaproteobacteria bacterium 42_54_T18]|nr:hypothetical protein A9Q81_07320 [Gammaproteobacteria bacterium 42_54_T18]
MNFITSKGFTLVEMMVVVSMVTLGAIYFTQLFIESSEQKIVDKEVASMMTIGTAAIGFVQDEGIWPDQVNNDCRNALAGVSESLTDSGYLGNGISLDNLTTSCDEVNNRYPIFTTTRSNFETENIAKMVAAMLPSAKATGKTVDMYTPRPRRESFPVFGRQVANDKGKITVAMPAGCDSPEIIVYPEVICSNSSTLGGYRIYTDKEGSSWTVYLKARSEDIFEDYSEVESCQVTPDISSEENLLAFRYVTFCL